MWIVVLTGGAILAITGSDPIALILVTQYAAGLSLPVLAIFLIVVMNRRDMLGRYTNGPVSNALGILVVLGVCALGALQIFGLV